MTASTARGILGTQTRRIVAVVAIVVASAFVVGLLSRPRSPEERHAAAAEILGRIHVSATVVSSSLAATWAIADFGLDEGIRLVAVRILEDLELELRIEVDQDVVLGGSPVVCLVGPFWAPDDAGLSDRCWGEPDLGEALEATLLAADPTGYPLLEAAHPIVMSVPLNRGDERCDYPPGDWQLEIAADPVVDGTPAGRVDLPVVTFTVPLETGGALPFYGVSDTRYCGLASVVYREQGEPQTTGR